MEGQIKANCYRIFGVLLLIIIFSVQAQASEVEVQASEVEASAVEAQASLPEKQSFDIADALEQSRIDMMQTMNTYNVGYQARLMLEDATLFDLNDEPERQIAQAPTAEASQTN
jgi:hypothetical protein